MTPYENLQLNFALAANHAAEICLSGKLDVYSAAQFQKKIEDYFQEHDLSKIIFVLKGLDHISSAGIGALVSIQQRARQKGGDIRLAELEPGIFQVFSVLNFTSIFHIDKTRQESRQALAL
jgi:anti-sigma B factor antagonist